MPAKRRNDTYAHGTEASKRAMAISKSDWMDLYADLYRQCIGELAPADDVIADALQRLDILRRYR